MTISGRGNQGGVRLLGQCPRLFGAFQRMTALPVSSRCKTNPLSAESPAVPRIQ